MENATVAAPTAQEIPCAACALMRNDGNRQYQLYKSLLAREKAVKEREEAQNSVDAEVTRLRSEIEELKRHGITAAPVAGNGKKRRLEEDKVTQGSSEKEQRLESEIRGLKADKDELLAKYNTSQADLKAAAGVQYRANKEHQKELAELEEKGADDRKKEYQKGLERGRQETRAQMNRTAQRNDDLQSQNAQHEAMASFKHQADLDKKKALNELEQKALAQCKIEYDNGMEAGRKEAQAQFNHMVQRDHNLQTQARQYETTIASYEDKNRQFEATIARYEGIIRQHEHDIASYKTNISQILQRATTAEAGVSRLAEELRQEKQGSSTTEERVAAVKSNLEDEKTKRESAENRVVSLKRELETEMSQRDAAEKEASNLKGRFEQEKNDKETAKANITNLKADLEAEKDATAEEKKLRTRDIQELAKVLGTSATNMPELRKDIQNMKETKAASVQGEDIRVLMKIIGTDAVNMSDVREGVRAMVEKAKKADKLRDVDIASLSKALGTESKSMSEIHEDIRVVMAKGKKVDVLGRNLQSLAKLLGTRSHTFDVRNAVVDLINKENAVANGQYVQISTIARQVGTSATTITQLQKDIQKVINEADQVVRLETDRNKLIAEVYRQKGHYADLEKKHNEILGETARLEVKVEKAKAKKIVPKQLGHFGGALFFIGCFYAFASCLLFDVAKLA
ncbi:hypothetical protein BDZ45DRAFT_742779 [Acephala macrosclerotiorum]|nr:hypothetical protein BDZ45DRAFT_742779 [Acephala macrosclerotiorum]